MPSRIESIVHASAALRGNPLGDPYERVLPVYLPDGYDDGGRRYPVVYVLAGYAGRGADLLAPPQWDEGLQQRLDRLIASGAMRPAIVALPDAMTRLGGSQYLDSPAVGAYQTYLRELVALVDDRLRTHADPDHRAVVGHSSGGFGALRLAMDHPGLVSVVVDRAGDAYFEWCYLAHFPAFLRAAARFGDLATVVAAPQAVPHPRGGDFFKLMETLCMSACYAPDPAAPLGFRLPVDLATGELDPAQWAQWKAHDPVELVASRAAGLRGLRLLLLEAGTRDEYGLHWGTRILAKRLEAVGVAYRHEEFADGHSGTRYRLDRCLPAAVAALAD